MNALQSSLTGRVNSSQIAENVSYYEDYIATQMRMGKSEEVVIAELGDPRLIAKSIIEASKRADARVGSRDDYRGDEENSYASGYNGDNGYNGSAFKRPQRSAMPVWLIVLLVILVVLLGISMIFSVFIFLAPILIPIAVVCLVLRLAGRRN